MKTSARRLKTRDPVCGRELDAASRCFWVDVRKHRLFFCSAQCLQEFQVRRERAQLDEWARAGALLTHRKVAWGYA